MLASISAGRVTQRKCEFLHEEGVLGYELDDGGDHVSLSAVVKSSWYPGRTAA